MKVYCACKLQSCTEELTSFICKPSKTDKKIGDEKVIKCLGLGKELNIECVIPNEKVRFRGKFAKFTKENEKYDIKLSSINLRANDVRALREDYGSLSISSCSQFPIFIENMNSSISMKELVLDQVIIPCGLKVNTIQRLIVVHKEIREQIKTIQKKFTIKPPLDANDFGQINQVYEKTINEFSQLEEDYVISQMTNFFNCYDNPPTITSIGSLHVNSYILDWTEDFDLRITEDLKLDGGLEIPTDDNIGRGAFIKELFQVVQRLDIEKIYGCPSDFTWLMDIIYKRLCDGRYTIIKLFDCPMKSTKVDTMPTIFSVHSNKTNEFSTIFGYTFSEDCKITIKPTKKSIKYLEVVNNTEKFKRNIGIQRVESLTKRKYPVFHDFPDFSKANLTRNKYAFLLSFSGIGC
ncbi:DgyrCDS5821 [Dimorphilus gyrociliatus]|uniref:DgyrCDS5821 n=1 Tax=Dimorphilus gyrociliatus TaxID=2664684 RepID=A0A7I8VLU9_9ANNE|nr:DgyrCDS5821 [Dimorphilus gyrociliatus]